MDTQLYINGTWRAASDGARIDVENPATGEKIGTVAKATAADINAAAEAAQAGFERWRQISALERAAKMRAAAALLRARADMIAPILTREQGKPLRDALSEVRGAADVLEWFADEGRRAYGRVIPARAPRVSAVAAKVPVGPVAGFCPWNYPISQAVRKISAALAAGCSIVVKAAEETPASTAEMVKCFDEAGIPDGVVNLLYGEPAQISEQLIAHPAIRAITFTGSTAVGRSLTELAARQLKRCTMELGGHAPYLVFADADLDAAADMLCAHKFHNAGQVCIAPTRVMVQETVFDQFLAQFKSLAEKIRMGDGMSETTDMGPLAHRRRIDAVDELVRDAVDCGGQLVLGGRPGENRGHFYEPTILANVPLSARIMSEEPFGPVAVVNSFVTADAAIAEANRLNYGLAAYGFSRSPAQIHRMGDEIVTGMISINHYGLAYPEVPFGGVRDSGFGNEGGFEALDDFLDTRFVSTLHI